MTWRAAFRLGSSARNMVSAAIAVRGQLKASGDLEKLRIEESEGLLANLAMQRARLLMAQDAALEFADLMLVNRRSGQIHSNLELVGKYLGELITRSVQRIFHYW